MNKKTILAIGKSTIIILLLLALAFALRAPAEDLNLLPSDIRGDYVDSSGLPYFSEMDSYYNLRLTDNYIDHGYVGDTYINGTEMDMHRSAPNGTEVNYELGIVYVTSLANNIANMFGSYSLKEVAFWTGAIVSCFAVIPAYIFTRRLTNDYGAITASLIIVLAPNYFAHTFPGFFDTDMFYYIFSLFFILFFMESLRSNNLVLKIVFAILSVISIGLFSISWTGYIFYIGVIGAFVIFYLILRFIFNYKSEGGEKYSNRFTWLIHQKDFLSIVGIVVVGVIGLSIFNGPDALFGRLFDLLSFQIVSTASMGFPNVLISVAEMQIPNLVGAGLGGAFLADPGGVVNGIGGITVLFAALIVLYTLVSRFFKLRSVKVKDETIKKPPKHARKASGKRIDENRFKLSLIELGDFHSEDEIHSTKRLNLMYTTLFISWIAVAIVAVTQGSRFITTLALPFGILAGLFAGYSVDYVKSKLDNNNWLMAISILGGCLAAFPLTQINRSYGIILLVAIVIIESILIYGLKGNEISFNNIPIKKYVVVAAIILALVSPSVCGAYNIANSVVPGTNDQMWDSMTWVHDNTENNTVISSWWDFGYLFEIAGDRQVTFDGGSQSGERAFWLGRAMSTDDMELSAGIFRMLDSTGDQAMATLYNYTDGDSARCIEILLKVLPLTADEGKDIMINDYDLTEAQASKIISYTHPANPRPVIFVASSDMLQKAGWWSYFGNWNFNAQNSTFLSYYLANQAYTINPGSSGVVPMLEDAGITFNVVINRGTDNNTTSAYTEAVYSNNGSQIYINDTAYNPLNISRLLVVEDGYVLKNETLPNSSNANYTLLLMGNKNQYTPVLMSNELENSMFTRLYLLGGADQNIYELVNMENGVSLWKINFNNTIAGGR